MKNPVPDTSIGDIPVISFTLFWILLVRDPCSLGSVWYVWFSPKLYTGTKLVPFFIASFTNPLRFLSVRSKLSGCESKDSSAPPGTIATALPFSDIFRAYVIDSASLGIIPKVRVYFQNDFE